jgi:glycosyltransferase involved in cell wall biosynthesis
MTLIDNNGEIKTVSIVIPTINEFSNIKEVFPKIPEFVDEIIVVDGCSTDGTVEEIKRYRSGAKIFIEKKLGKGAALRRGFKEASGDLIIMMDADGSNDIKELSLLIDPVLNGYDATKASRLLPGGGSDDFTAFRRFGNRMFVVMVNTLYGANCTDLCYGYRAFKKEALNKIKLKSDGFEVETEQSILMLKEGLKVKEVPSFEAKRKFGNSRLHSIKDGWRILRVIVTEYFK